MSHWLFFLADEKINSLETADWKSGRRIVNLYHLAVQLQSGCKKCKTPLNLINTTSERLQGAGSFLSIKCMKCKQITLITTDKRHQAPGKCMKMPTSWDVNSKLSLGNMIFLLIKLALTYTRSLTPTKHNQSAT